MKTLIYAGKKFGHKQLHDVLWWWTGRENYRYDVVCALRIREVTSFSLEKRRHIYSWQRWWSGCG